VNGRNELPAAAEEQLRYATWLHWGGWMGLLSLVGTFLLYATGMLTPVISFEQLPHVWGLPAAQLLHETGQSAGWAWLRLLDRGDVLNLVGIALLASCSAAPLLAVVPIYLRRGDRVFAILCLLQVAVLVLAASGVVNAGH
jgi:hypothetical protein